MDMIETWEFIPGYGEDYQASTYGRIKSFKRKETILKPDFHNGFYSLKIRRNNHPVRVYVHRLIALTFIGDQPHPILHKNKIHTDNRPENLFYKADHI
jgi:hypothetical protein